MLSARISECGKRAVAWFDRVRSMLNLQLKGDASTAMAHEKEASSTDFYTERTKPLAQLTPADVPLGLDPEDVASDYAPSKGEHSLKVAAR